ncbi:hypothetical protein TYRP_022095 [Tyrophagus putrescentiae]|nr:hypothetical protein TYRP_022095 [Tyrophagus putrescentiae]
MCSGSVHLVPERQVLLLGAWFLGALGAHRPRLTSELLSEVPGDASPSLALIFAPRIPTDFGPPPPAQAQRPLRFDINSATQLAWVLPHHHFASGPPATLRTANRFPEYLVTPHLHLLGSLLPYYLRTSDRHHQLGLNVLYDYPPTPPPNSLGYSRTTTLPQITLWAFVKHLTCPLKAK